MITDSLLPMAEVRRHYGPKSWIEGESERQLEELARLPGMLSIDAFPDLHPGKYGPVGIAAESVNTYPRIVGNDLGCGFSFFRLDVPARKLKADKVEERLRAAVFCSPENVALRLEEAGLSPELFPDALGSIGGGNHFLEVQTVQDATNGAPDASFAYLLVHSGSRSLGMHVWTDFCAEETNEDAISRWFVGHDNCVAWASLNRLLVAETAALALGTEVERLFDVPHNIVVRDGKMSRHYKGASCVAPGDIVPVAGSRDTLSHLVQALSSVALNGFGLSHGSGRKRDRTSMSRGSSPKKSEREAFSRNQWGGRVVCDDPVLMLEEQASAYKNSERVVSDLEEAGLGRRICALRPLVTYKKVLVDRDTKREPSWKREKRYSR